LPPLPSEQLLIDAIKRCHFSRAIVVSPGRGQSGWHARSLCPNGQISLWYVDQFRAEQGRAAANENEAIVDVLCSSDLPDETYQLALFPVLMRGEAEMTRDVLQQLHQRLEPGGRLVASVNNPKDHWLQSQMQSLFEKVQCQQAATGWVYTAIKKAELKKIRSFVAEFPFRDNERIIQLVTRPSVFSHRSLDTAARLLVTHSDITPGEHVLDFGCGSGAVAIAAAIRSQTGHVLAVDSNARAIECTQRGAELNGVENLAVILNHDGRLPPHVLPESGQFNVALLNPPYYGDFSIADHFMRSSANVLRPGGRAIVVTKQADAFHDHDWANLLLKSEHDVSGYQLLTYVKQC
jgi:16S rRNA (guanine1207-N2)-methyltransferase